MGMKSHEELIDLVAELLERFGVVELVPMDPDEMDAEDMADRLAGIEGYSLAFGQETYILLPDDVQDLFLDLASAIYSDEDEEDDEYLDEEE
jgi:hypothetical protein